MKSPGKQFKLAPFALALICFLLPFIHISCRQEAMQLKLISVTGVQLITGTEIQYQDQFAGESKSMKVASEPLAVIALLSAIAAILSGQFKSRTGSLLSAVAGGVGVICLLALKAKLDNGVMKQGAGSLIVDYQFGFIAAFVLLLVGACLNLHALKETRRGVERGAASLPPPPSPASVECVEQGAIWKPPPVTGGIESGTPPQSAGPAREWKPPPAETTPTSCSPSHARPAVTPRPEAGPIPQGRGVAGDWTPPPFKAGPIANLPARSPLPAFSLKPIHGFVALAVVVLCVGIALHKSLSGSVTLSFGLSLDGKPLASTKRPDVRVDGQPIGSGGRITPGRHRVTVQLQDAEPFERRCWVFYGAKQLGVLPLESSKGSLAVTVNPSPAAIMVQRLGQTFFEGSSPLKVEKLPVGDYALVVRRGQYQEGHQVRIQRQEKAEVKIDLNLGSVELSADPADAEFEMSGNGRRWQGKLPFRVDDVPVGSYQLVARRKGWELDRDVSVARGSVAVKITEFPYGSISVASEPTGLIISTNRVEVGKTPLVIREVRPGSYSLTASDGENDLVAPINVGPKQEAKHSFVFHYGALKLASTPVGATVTRRGKEVGNTPLMIERMPAGEAGLELHLNGYSSTNFVVRVREGTVTDFAVRLVSDCYVQAMQQANQALASGQFAESSNFIAKALNCEPDDSAAIKLKEELFRRAQFAADARSALEKETKRKEVVNIIEKAIAAQGGRDALTRFRKYKLVSTTTVTKSGAEYSAHATTYVQLPDKIRTDQELQKKGGLTTILGMPLRATYCVDGNTTWSLAEIPLVGTVVRPMPKPMENQLRELLYFNDCTSLVSLLVEGFQLEKLSSVPSAPPRSEAIRVRKSGKPDATLFFNTENGLLIGIDYEQREREGKSTLVDQRFSEFRDFAGLSSPTLIQMSRNGSLSDTQRTESIESGSFSEEVFRIPASATR